MVCGLDLWDYNIEALRANNGLGAVDEKKLRFNERRLENLLGVEYFRSPFPYFETGPNSKLPIPAVRFPSWHYCTNRQCGRMISIEMAAADNRIVCPECDENSKMIPIRFVAVCPKGHIQDVPFMEWVHDGYPSEDKEHKLFYSSLSGAGGLGSVLISCSCGESPRTLAGLMDVSKENGIVFDSALARVGLQKNKNKQPKFSVDDPNRPEKNPNGQFCRGYRPWLGPNGINYSNTCGEHLQVLVRGGSNIHYSDIISAIRLPEVSDGLNDYVAQVLSSKRSMLNKLKNNSAMLSIVLEDEEVVKKKLIPLEDLLSGIIKELNDSNDYNLEENEYTEQDIRREEFDFLLAGYQSEYSDLKAIRQSLKGYEEASFLDRYFDCVVLVEKLQETRVFKGFSRIDSSYKVDKSELSNEEVKWLPAYKVFGEGIFLQFKDSLIKSWQETYGKHFEKVVHRYKNEMLKWKPEDASKDINAAYVMIHTFAHLLIKRLCFSCGYGSSALRERIYFSSGDEKMNGILIYTSSGSSEGSLGGLVKQGKEAYLGKLVKEAIADAKWCSADPVCSDIGQSSGQGPNNVNGSACHNCCIVPETSCEQFNTLLDRATIVGTLDNPEWGFFDL